jgi:hypothetical protein
LRIACVSTTRPAFCCRILALAANGIGAGGGAAFATTG